MVLAGKVLFFSWVPILLGALLLGALLLAYRNPEQRDPASLASSVLAAIGAILGVGFALSGYSCSEAFGAMATSGSGGIRATSAGMWEALTIAWRAALSALTLLIAGLLLALRSQAAGPARDAESGRAVGGAIVLVLGALAPLGWLIPRRLFSMISMVLRPAEAATMESVAAVSQHLAFLVLAAVGLGVVMAGGYLTVFVLVTFARTMVRASRRLPTAAIWGTLGLGGLLLLWCGLGVHALRAMYYAGAMNGRLP